MLRVLRDRPSPVAAKDVLAALGEREGPDAGAPRELAITTVLTVLTGCAARAWSAGSAAAGRTCTRRR